MSFDYEQSIWGKGEATLNWSDPTNIRLRQALAALRSLLPHSKVLEVGCGAGQFIRALKRKRSEVIAYGCDISRSAIDTALAKNDHVSYVVSDPERLPYADNEFDAVVFFDVLEHVNNPAGLLQEIWRVLKPKGVLYGFVPCERDWLSVWHWLDMFGLKREVTKKYAGHINFFSRSELLELLTAQQYNVAQVRYSEHVFGQLLGVAAFYYMDYTAHRTGVTQVNNESAVASLWQRVPFRWLKQFVNMLVTVESFVLSRVPSPNVHFVVLKK